MVTGMMIFFFALMVFGLVITAYSAVSKMKRKGRQSGRFQRKPDEEGPDGKRQIPMIRRARMEA